MGISIFNATLVERIAKKNVEKSTLWKRLSKVLTRFQCNAKGEADSPTRIIAPAACKETTVAYAAKTTRIGRIKNLPYPIKKK